MRQASGETDMDMDGESKSEVPGIIIRGGSGSGSARTPRIQAFVWGGKVLPTPVLPYGRWKGAA